ncbi:MAG: ribonuclease HI [Candidatus Pacebacteria bacterium]|nr:ribonuclease HI [Candidatus Paceibacterota bacterium]
MIEIYTDGSSLGNPGPGGWGVVVVLDNKIIKEISGGEKNTTNNKMELTGAIEALRYLIDSKDENSIIYTDSAYVLGGVTSWINNWEKNGWKTANKKPVLNKELWLELVSLSRKLGDRISWQKVKGHSGHIYNDKADEIATSRASLQK